MADQDAVRRIAMSLPGVTEGDDRFGFSVLNKGKYKGIAWSWAERVDPKEARVINDTVLAIRVDGELAKQSLIAAEPDKFFTEPHYNGFPAVLVRLAAIPEDELEELLIDAWRIQAPRDAVKAYDSSH
jgi:hypothetical protein